MNDSDCEHSVLVQTADVSLTEILKKTQHSLLNAWRSTITFISKAWGQSFRQTYNIGMRFLKPLFWQTDDDDLMTSFWQTNDLMLVMR